MESKKREENGSGREREGGGEEKDDKGWIVIDKWEKAYMNVGNSDED